MKNISIVTAVTLLTCTLVFSQRREYQSRHKELYNHLSIDELATLKTKKMTLALDLSEKQQREIFDLNLSEAQFKKERKDNVSERKEAGEQAKLRPKQRYVLENQRLDYKIAQQEKIKRILTDEQYNQWKKIELHRHKRAKKSCKGKGTI